MAGIDGAVGALSAIAATAVEAVVLHHFALVGALRQRIRESGLLEPTADDPDGAGYLGIGDHTMLRYLRARKWDLKKAFDMYSKTLEWRREGDVDRWRREAPGNTRPCAACAALAAEQGFRSVGGVEAHPEARLVGPNPKEHLYRTFTAASAFGHDRAGRPIYFERQGECSQGLSRMMKHIARQDVVLMHIRQQEIAMARIEESELRLGRRVDGQFVIADMATLSMWPNSDGQWLFKSIQKIDEAHYPETLGVQFIVNAPAVFTVIWKVVKWWLDPATRAKVQIYSGGKEHWQHELHKYVDPAQLPEEYGGTLPLEVDRMRLDVELGKRFAAELYGHPVPRCKACISAPRTPAGRRSRRSSLATEPDLYTCVEHEPADAPPNGVAQLKPAGHSEGNDSATPEPAVVTPTTGTSPLLVAQGEPRCGAAQIPVPPALQLRRDPGSPRPRRQSRCGPCCVVS
eukprot:TRINITY_DN56142_c0_g1_i1.p1 TRINITY_DN56142_c0_g1~~TRINITY_DN56142_c0_g1_i1.p1  ORF type:complete len:459 (+),score=115.18 TRINITY_DN56142_c0_g1_i1:99-1475(+)